MKKVTEKIETHYSTSMMGFWAHWSRHWDLARSQSGLHPKGKGGASNRMDHKAWDPMMRASRPSQDQHRRMSQEFAPLARQGVDPGTEGHCRQGKRDYYTDQP